MRKKQDQPIGVFDSGLGGLTVVRELRRVLPHEHIVYFGDLARLPYGAKSQRQIIEFSHNNVRFLRRQKVKAIIVACNSSASSAATVLRSTYAEPVIDVISAAAQDAVVLTRARRIGIVGTTATIESGVYQRYIKRLLPAAHVFAVPCPLFVPLVEEGWLADPVTYDIAEKYLAVLKRRNVDVVILGCTHYPLLKRVIAEVLGPSISLIESAPGTVRELIGILEREDALRQKGKGSLSVFVSDKSRNFVAIGSRFLGAPLTGVSTVQW